MSEYRGTMDLITQDYTSDDIGNQIPVESRRTVFCKVKSVRQSEFYAAKTADLKPEIMFEMRAEEYKGETEAEYCGQRYTVVRTYSTGYEKLELICERVIANRKKS